MTDVVQRAPRNGEEGWRVEPNGAGRQFVNLDANANAPVTPTVAAAIAKALVGAANPSSAHAGGAAARSILARARDSVAALAEGVFDDGVVFTSGCTEANNTVLRSARASGATLVISDVEHPSILAPAAILAGEGVAVERVGVDRHGRLDLAKLDQVLRDTRGPIVLSVQTANSETGVVQPIAEIAALAKRRGDVLFHTDAAQSFGKLTTSLNPDGGPHAASVSAHKLHGPMGVGALLLADGEERVHPLLHGGDQEARRRAGTEPLALIAGMAAACSERAESLVEHVDAMERMRDRLEAGILDGVRGARSNGAGAPRLPNTASVRFPGVDAMALVAHLDRAAILTSQGSACSSMRPTPSHVLLAMGLTEAEAFSTVRFSVSPSNTTAEIEVATAAVIDACRSASVAS